MGLRKKTDSSQKNNKALQTGTAPQHYQPAKHYHDNDVELDAIERLKSNILMLDDLGQRLQFMNKELKSIIGLKQR